MAEKAKESAKKKIDKAWKEAVARGEEAEGPVKAKGMEAEAPPEMDFSLFISSLGMQILMGLGEITNPVTKKKEENLEQARQTIDIIGMLKEKTRGNLTEDESKILDNLLYELRMKYIDKAGEKTK